MQLKQSFGYSFWQLLYCCIFVFFYDDASACMSLAIIFYTDTFYARCYSLSHQGVIVIGIGLIVFYMRYDFGTQTEIHAPLI